LLVGFPSGQRDQTVNLTRTGLLLLLLPAAAFGLNCQDDLVRGVNLGGLFLLEPWITPTIFEEVNDALDHKVVDEYTYAQYVDKDFARERLNRHWDTFYSKADLQELADSGISHIRIPIGYWLVDVSEDEPFPPPPADDTEGQRFYLKRVFQWCEEIGLKILVDLHGAPESQNGFDNSGRRGDVNWFDPNDNSNVDRTVVILGKVTELLVSWIADGTISDSTLFGVEVLNEPSGWIEELWVEIRDNFHYNAYDVIRTRLTDDVLHKIVIQQAFRSPQDFVGYMEDYPGTGLDLHNYQCFGDYWNALADDPNGWYTHLDAACDYVWETGVQTLHTVCGEWSLAVTDCQKYLDGGYGNPYEPPNASQSACEYYNGNFTTYPAEYRDFLRQYMVAQMDAFEAADGWFFWTAKTENNCGPEWDYLLLLQNGIAPQNLCERETYCYGAERSQRRQKMGL
jgi:glucan 1,3-beta-glucosidase